METITFTQSNYRQGHNTFQLFLPLDLSVYIPENDISFTFVDQGHLSLRDMEMHAKQTFVMCVFQKK